MTAWRNPSPEHRFLIFSFENFISNFRKCENNMSTYRCLNFHQIILSFVFYTNNKGGKINQVFVTFLQPQFCDFFYPKYNVLFNKLFVYVEDITVYQ
jgi:hypothetical protein